MAKSDDILEIFGFDKKSDLKLPLYNSSVQAGFPSPADDYIDKKLDLNEYLIKHPAATFFVRVAGDSMINAGIHNNDILIVDRALNPCNGNIVIAVLDGELTVKRLKYEKSKVYLEPENPKYPVLEVYDESQFEIWGVVTNVIHGVL
ncbi:MAG: translesion error-prone DNA polymerase V autoproteolytic subunit [Candidatus Delongbacteria bacterium]|nr:translesion error-prone DNA polymerase V autoproteolytic subunit [Candidatus Delongbacteria bacterium]MBN2836572.1 translesion error-prone DNA polymerase V autoproteolytic subunit [Candidatus Delongbacteria bacterium]